MKKLITILTVVAVFGLAGCGGSGSSRSSTGPTPTPPQTPDQARAVAVNSPPTIPASPPATALEGEIVRQDSLSDRIAVLGSDVDTTTVVGSTTFTVEGTFAEAAPIAGFTPTVALTSTGLMNGEGIFKDAFEAGDNPCAGLTGVCTPLEISQALSAYDILPASIKDSITKADFETQLAASPNLETLIFNLLPTAISDLEDVTVASIATLLMTVGVSAYDVLPADFKILAAPFLGAVDSDTAKMRFNVVLAGEYNMALEDAGISEDTFDGLKAANPLIMAVAGNSGLMDIDLEQLRGRSSGNFDASIVRWKYGTADNYLTLGYWTYVPDVNVGEDGHNAEVGADVHGDDPFTPGNVAGLIGTATYNGNAFGKAGDDNFVADASLTANFNDNTIVGMIDEFNHDPDLMVTLSEAAITGNSFTGLTSAAAAAGNWGGRFYGNTLGDTSAHPLAVGGTFGVANEGADTILGVFGAGLVTP